MSSPSATATTSIVWRRPQLPAAPLADDVPGGMKIDGALEARHFLGDSIAVGVPTAVGPVDVVLERRGYEDGYAALAADTTTVQRGDIVIQVGALVDLVRSKELLSREKDLQHLAVLYEQRPELSLPEIGQEPDHGWPLGGSASRS